MAQKRQAESSVSPTPAKKKAGDEKPEKEVAKKDPVAEEEAKQSGGDAEPYADIPSSLLKCHVCDGLGQKVDNRTAAEFVAHLKTQSHLDLLEMLAEEIAKEADVIRCWVKRQEAIKKIQTPDTTT